MAETGYTLKGYLEGTGVCGDKGDRGIRGNRRGLGGKEGIWGWQAAAWEETPRLWRRGRDALGGRQVKGGRGPGSLDVRGGGGRLRELFFFKFFFKQRGRSLWL